MAGIPAFPTIRKLTQLDDTPRPVSGDDGKVLSYQHSAGAFVMTVGVPGPPAGAASGDLTGSYPSPTIASGAVSTSKLADSAVTSAKIAEGTVRTADLASGLLSVNINDPVYGAAPGVSDNVAAIQAAIDALAAAGGGRLTAHIPGTYNLVTFESFGGVDWHLDCAGDNIMIDFPFSVLLRTTRANTKTLFAGGHLKAGASTWYTAAQSAVQMPGQSAPTVYNLAGDVVNVTGATNASPIAVTATAHGLVTGDTVTITGVGGNTAANGTWVITVVDVNTFTLTGSTGNGAYTSGGVARVVYPRGTFRLRLQNAADATTLVGKRVLVRTGQLVDGSSDTEPDCEINEGLSAAGAVLTLRYPLMATYAQEFRINGGEGVGKPTSTTGAGPAAPFGLTDLTGKLQLNLDIASLRVEGPSSGDFPVAVAARQIDGLRFGKVECNGQLLDDMHFVRNPRFEDIAVYYNDAADKIGMVLGAVGVTNPVVEKAILANARGGIQIHCHEGTKQPTLKSYRIYSKPSGEFPAISIRDRIYDALFEPGVIETTGTGTVIYIGPNCDDGGVFRAPFVRGANFTNALDIYSRGWMIDPSLLSSLGIYSAGNKGPFVVVPARVNWNASKRTETLGIIPAGSYVYDVVLFVDQAFSGGGISTATVSIGTDANYAYFAGPENVLTAGSKDSMVVYRGWRVTSPLTAKVFFEYTGGTGPTNGYATVLFIYYPAAHSPYA